MHEGHPGTHHGGSSEYQEVDTSANVFSREIVESQRDESRAVSLELRPSQGSLHDGRIMHGSDANTSAIRHAHTR